MKTIAITFLMACALIIGACSEDPVESVTELENTYDRCYHEWLNNVWCE